MRFVCIIVVVTVECQLV